MKSRIILFIIGFIVWMLLGWSFDMQHALMGIAVAGVVVFFAGGIVSQSPHRGTHPSRYFWFCYYVVLFLWECIKANLDGAYRVLHPDLPIHPGIVRVKTGLRSDIGLTFLANSLTLQPGTMTVEIDKANGILYIHWVDVKSQDIQKASELIAQRFEKILQRIFE